jgi:hypothetical protein
VGVHTVVENTQEIILTTQYLPTEDMQLGTMQPAAVPVADPEAPGSGTADTTSPSSTSSTIPSSVPTSPSSIPYHLRFKSPFTYTGARPVLPNTLLVVGCCPCGSDLKLSLKNDKSTRPVPECFAVSAKLYRPPIKYLSYFHDPSFVPDPSVSAGQRYKVCPESTAELPSVSRQLFKTALSGLVSSNNASTAGKNSTKLRKPPPATASSFFKNSKPPTQAGKSKK